MEYTATYSPEDNKLRIYASERLDEETYRRARELGFKWAPRQELFVAPKWTPAREDFCIELAGELATEQTTLAERAEAKIERLGGIIANAEERASRYHAAADSIAERFWGGQPILVGHHSERRARRDQEKIHSNMSRSVKESRKVQHFQWKAEGVARHANRKNSDRTRARRIQTLLTDLRDRQREINKAEKMVKLIAKLQQMGDTEERKNILANNYFEIGQRETFYKAEQGEVTWEDYLDKAAAAWEKYRASPIHVRWLVHILNRLAYEQNLLGEVKRFDGDLTPAILQVFARTHGAEKPKATKTDNGWKLVSPITLPMHIGDGSNELELDGDGWRELMQNTGYEVPAKRPAKPSILNFEAERIAVNTWGGVAVYEQISLTKEEYSRLRSENRGTALSSCGTFRVKTCPDPSDHSWKSPRRVVFLTDSKVHPTPESEAINPVLETADA